MGNDIGQLCFICPGGNVDARFEETKNKRCLYIVTNPNVVPHRKGCTDFLLQAEIADGSINEHGYDAYCPYDCQHRNQKLKWICACNWLWSKGVRNYGEIHDGYAIVKSSYNEAVDNSRQKNGVVISTMTSMAKEAYQYIEYDNNLKVKNVIDIKAMIPEELMKEIQECQSQAVAAPSGNELAWSTESGIYVLNLETQELMHHEPEVDGYSQYEIAFIDENKLGFYKSKGDEIIDTKYGYWSLISDKMFYDEQRCYSPNQIRVSGNYLILNDGENPLTDTSSGKVVIYNCEENQSVVFKVDNTESTFSYITKDGAHLIAYTCINDNLTKHRVRVYQLSDKKCISENTFETEVGVQFYDFRNNENGYWLIGNEDTKRVVYNVFTTQ